jgi:hypothetical protein
MNGSNHHHGSESTSSGTYDNSFGTGLSVEQKRRFPRSCSPFFPECKRGLNLTFPGGYVHGQSVGHTSWTVGLAVPHRWDGPRYGAHLVLGNPMGMEMA